MPTIADIRKKYPQYNDLSDQQLAEGFRRKYYSDMPEGEFYGKLGISGGGTGFQKSDVIDDIQRGTGSLLSGAGSALRDVNEDAGKWLQSYGDSVVQNNPADYTSYKDINGIGDFGAFAAEKLAENVPQLLFGTVGAVATGGVGGMVAFGLPTAVTTYGGAREEQRKVGVEDKTRAAGMAALAAALDAGTGVGRVFSPGKAAAELIDVGIKGVGKAAAKGSAEEAVTETIQTGLERFGGYQDVASPEAQEEYITSGLAGAIMGGPFAGARTQYENVAARRAGPPAPGEEAASPAPSVAPPGISGAPAKATIPIFRQDIDNPDVVTEAPLEIISDPDEAGNIWVRDPEFGERQIGAQELDILRQRPSEAAPVSEPVAAAPVAPVAPVVEPVVEPVAPPAPTAIVEPVAAPVAAPVVEPIAAPEPVVEPEPVAVAPAPVIAPPAPVTIAEPEPVAVAAPEPVAIAEPEPVAVAEAEPVAVEPMAVEHAPEPEADKSYITRLPEKLPQKNYNTQGWGAYGQGWKLTDNPYAQYSRPALAWEKGWRSGRRAETAKPRTISTNPYVTEKGNPTDVIDMIRRAGGLRTLGDASRHDLYRTVGQNFPKGKARPGFFSNKPEGKTLDEIGQLLLDGGYVTERPGSEGEVIDIINDAIGKKRLPLQYIGTEAEAVSEEPEMTQAEQDIFSLGATRPEYDFISDQLRSVGVEPQEGARYEELTADLQRVMESAGIADIEDLIELESRIDNILGPDLAREATERAQDGDFIDLYEEPGYAEAVERDVAEGRAAAEGDGAPAEGVGPEPTGVGEGVTSREVAEAPEQAPAATPEAFELKAPEAAPKKAAPTAAEEPSLPGMEPSAKQAGQARGEKMRAKAEQEAPGALFEAKAPETVDIEEVISKPSLAVSDKYSEKVADAEDVISTARETKSLRQSLDALTAKEGPLGEFAQRILKVAPDIKVEVLTDKQITERARKNGDDIKDGQIVNGMYDPKSDTVYLNEEMNDASTIIHEAAHAIADYHIDSKTDLGKLLTDTFNRYSEAAGAEPGHRGLTDAKEFVAYIWNSEMFRDKLRAMNVPGTKQTFWTRVRNIIRSILGVKKLDDVDTILEISEKAAAMRGTTSGKSSLSVQDADPALATNPETGEPINVNYSLTSESVKDMLTRKWADRLRRLGYVEEQIENAIGRPIPRALKPSVWAARYEKKANEYLDELDRDHIQKISEYLQKSGISQKEADEFLYARAAKDRNAKIRNRNLEFQEPIPGLEVDEDQRIMNGSGMTDAQSDAIMRDFAARGRLTKLNRLGEMVDKLVDSNLAYRVETGLLSQSEADRLRKDEPHYVPLKGFAVDGDLTIEGDPNPHSGDAIGRGFRITSKEFRKAKGRSSMAFSPLANLFADSQTAIIRGQKNIVGQKFLDFATEYKSNAWSVTRKMYPDTRPEEYLIVKKGGDSYYIRIKDPFLLRALTNSGTETLSGFWGGVVNISRVATTSLSRLHTTLNPEFAITNLMRDVQAAVFNLLSEQGRADGALLGKKIIKNVIKDISPISQNFKLLARASLNHTATTEEQRIANEWFLRAKKAGAVTGWIMREDPQQQYDKLNKMLGEAEAEGAKKAWYSTRNTVSNWIQKLEDWNSIPENVVRVSVFKNAIEAGLSEVEAADMASNVTVDFNKKGEASQIANSIWAFFNATVQGNVQLIRSLGGSTPDGRRTMAQKVIGSAALLGASLAFINAALSDEDKDGELFFDKIPDYEKERNLIVMSPDGKNYIKIPMPYGYSLFPYMGGKLADMMRGKASAGDVGYSLVKGVVNSFSPIQLIGEQSFLPAVSPTVLKPFIELAVNENFFGSPIYNEPFDESQSKSSVSRYSTPEGYKAVAEFLNDATGGRGKIPGAVDVPAESLQHLLLAHVGGLGRFVGGAIELPVSAVKGEPPELKDAIFLRRVLGTPNDQNDLGKFYDRTTAIASIEKQLKDTNASDARFIREKYGVDANPRVIHAKKTANSEIRALNKQLQAMRNRESSAATEAAVDRINERKHDIYLRFNKIYNDVEERGR